MNAREIEDVLKTYDVQWNVEYKAQFSYVNIIEILTKQWNTQNGKMAEWEQIFKVFDVKYLLVLGTRSRSG